MSAPSVKAGALLIVGFEGTRVPDALRARIAEGRVGGVIAFSRNLGSVEEICALGCDAEASLPVDAPPLVVSIDQEGGRVQRIKAPLALWPPMANVGAKSDAGLVERIGAAMGAELGAFGFNVDYAPVLDVHTNPANPIIGDRAFGTEPVSAAEMALAYLRGLESSGVRGCGKHYPGHGDTATDSHLELPRVDATWQRLREVELEPFRRAARAGVGMLMTAHVVYSAVDDKPATMSRRWIQEILRGELAYDGVVVSDDLDMKAVAAKWPVEETVIESLMAGVDCFLACRDPEIMSRAERALDAAAAKHADVAARIAESTARMEKFRRSLLRSAGSANAVAKLPSADYGKLAASAR